MNKSLAAILVIIVITLSLVAVAYFVPSVLQNQKVLKNDILSISSINLVQRGTADANGELQGGDWRILATSQNQAIVNFVMFNETTAQNMGAIPSDVSIQGNIYVEVDQADLPYWVIPIVPLNIGPNGGNVITVSPAMTGTDLTSGAPVQDSTGKTAQVQVSLWTLNMAQKHVVIPFRVYVAKNAGSNPGYLTVDTASIPAGVSVTQQTDASGHQYWSCIYTENDVSNNLNSKLRFYNPKAPAENLTLTLEFSIGNFDTYSFTQNLVFVTPLNGGPAMASNTFSAADETAIAQQLNWLSGSDWTFQNYWFGGGNTFLGSFQIVPVSQGVNTGKIQAWSDGRSNAMGVAPRLYPAGMATPALLSCGYLSASTTTNGIYEYPGWYAPFSSVYSQGYTTTSVNPQNKRYPIQPNVLAGTGNNPSGVIGDSVVDYLASSVVAPITHSVHSAFARVNPDIWGQGTPQTVIGVNGALGVDMPLQARSWVFDLDISTQLADTVVKPVVVQQYVNVKFNGNPQVSATTIQPGASATITASLTNTSPFGGTASINLISPTGLQNVASISGGGPLNFAAGETQTVTFTVTNVGTVTTSTSGSFILQVVNTNSQITDSKTITFTFQPGIGVPDTILTVTCKDGTTGQAMNGISISTSSTGSVISGSTGSGGVNGQVQLDLGTYTGVVTVKAVDPTGTYAPASQALTVIAGDHNPVVFALYKMGTSGGGGFSLTMTDWYIIIGAVVAVLITVGVGVAVKKPKHRNRR